MLPTAFIWTQRQYSANDAQKLALASRALLLASLGLIGARWIPGALGYGCLLLPLVGIAEILAAFYNQLVFSQGQLIYRSFTAAWQLDLAQINGYQLIPTHRGLCLELRTTSGQIYEVSRLKNLGIYDPHQFTLFLSSQLKTAAYEAHLPTAKPVESRRVVIKLGSRFQAKRLLKAKLQKSQGATVLPLAYGSDPTGLFCYRTAFENQLRVRISLESRGNSLVSQSLGTVKKQLNL
jgi:hypothetical protein